VKKSVRRLYLASLMVFGLSTGTALLPGTASAQEATGPVFELRTYKATPGNLDKLLTRFRDHTMRILKNTA